MPKFLPSTAHRSTCMCIFLLAVFPHKRATIKAAADMNDHCCIGRHIDGETHNIAQQLCSLQITNQSRHCRSRLMVTNGRGVTVWISNEVCQKHPLQTARHSQQQSLVQVELLLQHSMLAQSYIARTGEAKPECTLASGFATQQNNNDEAMQTQTHAWIWLRHTDRTEHALPTDSILSCCSCL